MQPSTDPILDHAPAEEPIEELWRRLRRADDRQPVADLERAVARREEITPMLLAELEAGIAAPETLTADSVAVPHALLLLGQFRERRAFPLILRLLDLEDETVELVLGDMITETLPALLSATVGDRSDALKALFLDARKDPFIRESGLRALASHMVRGGFDRAEFVRFVTEATALIPKDTDVIWDEIAIIVADLQIEELRDLGLRLFAEGLIETSSINRDEFEESFLPINGPHLENYRTEIDAIEDSAWWDLEAASGDDADGEGSGEDDVAGSLELPEHVHSAAGTCSDCGEVHGGAPPRELPFVHETPKTGRNDPCPCGSGKKFKKCCG